MAVITTTAGSGLIADMTVATATITIVAGMIMVDATTMIAMMVLIAGTTVRIPGIE